MQVAVMWDIAKLKYYSGFYQLDFDIQNSSTQFITPKIINNF